MVTALILLAALCAPAPLAVKPPPPVKIAVVAVLASNTEHAGRQYEPGLEKVQGALADLPFNTFRPLQTATVSAPFNEETTVSLTERHRLYLRPMSKEPNRQVRLNMRLHLTRKPDGDKPPAVTAVNTTIITGPGRQMKLRGVKLDGGELVVVVTVIE